MTARALHIVCPQCDRVNRVPEDRLSDGAKCGHCHAGLFQGQPLELTAANFERQISSHEIPVLVDFWAPWCGPCRSMAPAFAQAAAQLEPHMRLAKVNTEAEQELAQQFGIRSIPTLVLFNGGREVSRSAGAMDLRTIVAWTRQYL